MAPALLFFTTFVLLEAKLCLHKQVLLIFFRKNAPLHWSAYGGHLETCRLLLQCNANVQAKDRE